MGRRWDLHRNRVAEWMRMRMRMRMRPRRHGVRVRVRLLLLSNCSAVMLQSIAEKCEYVHGVYYIYIFLFLFLAGQIPG
jgi:hypothetical protein